MNARIIYAMSEVRSSAEIVPEDMVAALEKLQSDVSEASFLLTSWYTSQDSDSVSRQNLRKTEYGQACGRLRAAVGAARQVGNEIRVVVAEDSEPAGTHTMSKNAYDFVEVGSSLRGEIEPGGSFALKTEKTLTNYIARVSHVYFGGYSYYLEAADIAEILGKGGRLEVVPIEPDNPTKP